MFLTEFEDFLTNLSQYNEYLFFIGDFNINIEEKNNITKQFISLLKTFNLTQLVKDATHIQNGILDLVIVDKTLVLEQSEVFVDRTFQTDHFPVCVSLKGQAKTSTKIIKLVRDFNNINITILKEDLINEFNSFNFSKRTPGAELINIYNTVMSELRDKHCIEKKKVYRTNRNLTKWYNKSLQILKTKKRKAERNLKKIDTEEYRNKYKRIRNLYNLELEKSRSKFYCEKLLECKNDSKLLFSRLNKLTGNYKEKILPSLGSDKQTANALADFFHKKIENIRKQIQFDMSKTNIKQQTRAGCVRSFNKFSEINQAELKILLNKVKNKTCALDIFPTKIIKDCNPVLDKILIAIINSSFNNGTFPENLKHAIVSPIVKDTKKDENDLSNYRPVCSSPFVAKIPELAAFEQLHVHISQYNLHAKNQSAYRRNHSCETAIFKMVGDIQKFMADKHLVALISLDSLAAFDTIDHRILLNRLESEFYITGDALKWI